MKEDAKKTELYVGDISQYNTIQQYTLLKEHFDGIIVRVGYRGYSAGTIKKDALFAKHMQGLTENSIPYGFYFMGQAVTEQEAVLEAEYCHEMTKKYSPSLPVYYDSELSNPKGHGRADHLSRRQRTDITRAFCQRILQFGMRAGVYASKNWFETKLYAEELAEYSIWVACYNASLDYHETGYDMWQYTSAYRITGLDIKLDRSYCYRAFDQSDTDGAKPEEEPLLEVREGVYRGSECYEVSGFGKTEGYLVKGQTVTTVRCNDRNEYVRLLQEKLGVDTDGIFGAETEAAVRQFQKTHGLTVDGVAGIQTWNALL